ncbi:class I SAM-dependent methyltransferase [uncultured Hoeflea sp.]|uniref:class I SAM-dependent methyltransferase n=1 Tax=uncultured Hoeflea sp. TaxID=538666 RepID=UPI0026248F8D|nr:class I SAM-dependent methyltransferase [uncultured Hoeflea sp.]
MPYCYARKLPQFLRNPLFGDRDRHGPVIDETDPSWVEYKSRFFDFYESTQKGGIGKTINDAGYGVLRDIDLNGKRVAEIGPGSMPHRSFWNGTPATFTAVDISKEFLEMTASKVDCPFEAVHLDGRSRKLPLPDDSFDVLISFYSLEHLSPLDGHLEEYARVLKPGGVFVGAIPNEGGLAWGVGRYLTSRRWVLRNTTIDYDKIICWEHPNFADSILMGLDRYFEREKISMYPFSVVNSLDINLVTKFRYRKPA